MKAVLVYKPDHIGDVVLLTPVLEAIRSAYPHAYVGAIVGPWSVGVLANNPHVSEVFPYTSRYMQRDNADNRTILVENRRTLHSVNAMNADVTIVARDDYEHVLQGYIFSRGRGRLIAHVANHSRRNLVTDAVDYAYGAHEVVRNLGLLRPLGISVPTEISPKVYPNAESEQRARELVSDTIAKRAVCLFPGGGHPLNYWPIERFIVLGEMLAQCGWTPVYVGGASEAAMLEQYSTRLEGMGASNLAGCTNILDLAAVCRRVGRIVANDGGPMHVAAAAGAEVVALFGSSSKSFYPYGEQHTVIDHEWDCSPCPHFTYEHRITCADNLCIKSIDIEEVWRTVQRKWQIK